jgi:DNA-directed RNA polymerase subunit A'
MDAISGNYMLTKYLDNVLREEAIQMLISVGVEDIKRLPNKERVSGRDIFSVVLPEDFSFNGKARDGSPVIIENGKLKEGVMDKANLGEGHGLMLRNIHKKYGSERAMEILGKIFRLGIKALQTTGLTAAISDTDLTEEGKTRVQSILTEAQNEVSRLVETFHKNELEAFPGRTIEETLELRILEALNKARNEAGKVTQETVNKLGHTAILIDSGAKGTVISMAQMASVVGQQALRGKRMDKGYDERTLSCFERNDLSPKAKGFVENSFKKGLKPHEFYFMSMTGRDSLMDTALRTPKSGYLYRRLANAMQDIRVEYDSTVRDATGKIVQFKYGGDGIDVSKSEGGTINIKKIIETINE